MMLKESSILRKFNAETVAVHWRPLGNKTRRKTVNHIEKFKTRNCDSSIEFVILHETEFYFCEWNQCSLYFINIYKM